MEYCRLRCCSVLAHNDEPPHKHHNAAREHAPITRGVFMELAFAQLRARTKDAIDDAARIVGAARLAILRSQHIHRSAHAPLTMSQSVARSCTSPLGWLLFKCTHKIVARCRMKLEPLECATL